MIRKLKKLLDRPHSGKLEKDAVDIDDRRSSARTTAPPTVIIEPADATAVNVIKHTSNQLSTEIVPRHDRQMVPASPTHSDTVAIPSGQIFNAMQMQNVQNQSVYQFSNCTSLHFGPVLINNGSNSPGSRSPSRSGSQDGGSGRRLSEKKIKTTSIDGENTV